MTPENKTEIAFGSAPAFLVGLLFSLYSWCWHLVGLATSETQPAADKWWLLYIAGGLAIYVSLAGALRLPDTLLRPERSACLQLVVAHRIIFFPFVVLSVVGLYYDLRIAYKSTNCCDYIAGTLITTVVAAGAAFFQIKCFHPWIIHRAKAAA